ncbi:hypothetical protein G9U51_00650 [Calidifontibacter sp. DB0510]|uniref:Uncharacterized protein n=1 Tax=Metallococcus carri TaxID=1656884 RepID=A0A967AX29_9MICO|nr:hypothetical protein [Metallococcus carri]NHN54293.1 hypothetical protein [Metallococcus carri]NOP36867.1 hypothetical protein [Calidifontibacter sp. DB2511S]
MATVLQASLLVRHSTPEVGDAFVASRLDAPAGVFGAPPHGLDTAAIVRRADPLPA